MRKLVPLFSATCLIAGCISVAASPAWAADPTIAQVHAAAEAGQTGRALSMMDMVLKDHPQSAKAHYVEAELLGREHRLDEGRAELAKAEAIAPGLSFAKPGSVAQLERQLSGTSTTALTGYPAGRTPHIPWLPVLAIGAGLLALLAFMRRRAAAAQAYGGQQVYRAMPGYGMQEPPYPSGPWDAPQSGGLGSGLLGSLAGGAAMGAGFAAGEEIVDHMFGDRHETRNAFGGDVGSEGQDLGGNDFGISDDGSWDDDSSGGGW